MANDAHTNPASIPQALDINGLTGRMIRMHAPKNKAAEILVVYDQLSSLERWEPLVQYLNHYAAVTAPDLPGFGGMNSFYSIDKRPSLDAYAGFLAAFVKLRYRRKRVAIVGIGFGFAVTTRMLERYPSLTNHVRLVVGIDGMTRYDDARLTVWRRRWLLIRDSICVLPGIAPLIRLAYLNKRLLPRIIAHSNDVIGMANPKKREALIAARVELWRRNDLRTYAYVSRELLKLDNCIKRVAIPLWHVALDNGKQRHLIEQHQKVVYEQVTWADVKVASADLFQLDQPIVSRLIPTALRKALAKD